MCNRKQKSGVSKKISFAGMIAVITVTVVLLLPILRLAFYNSPCADDFNYSAQTYHAWNQTHSLWAVLGEAVGTARNYWYVWQGTYSAAIVMAFQPGIFGFGWYALGTFLLVGSIVAANAFLAWYLLRRKGGTSKVQFLYIGALLTLCSIQFMPSPVQGLYWYNGACYYVLFHSLQMFYYCLLISLWKKSSGKLSIGKIILGILLSVVIAGCNYVTAFGSILVLACAVLLGGVLKSRRAALMYALFLVITLVGFYINAASPGTEVRASSINMQTGLKAAVIAICNSILAGCSFTVEWTTFPVLGCAVLSALVLYPLAGRVGEKTGFRFPYPPLVTVLSVAWLSAMFCPPMYAEGDAGAGRLINIVYFDYVLLLFLNVFYYSGWFQTRICAKRERLYRGYRVALVLSVVAICAGLYSAVSAKAVRSITNGEAELYAQESLERYEIYMQSAGKDVRVDSYSVKPELLYFDDITEDPGDWRNQSLAQYYDVASVALR